MELQNIVTLLIKIESAMMLRCRLINFAQLIFNRAMSMAWKYFLIRSCGLSVKRARLSLEKNLKSASKLSLRINLKSVLVVSTE